MLSSRPLTSGTRILAIWLLVAGIAIGLRLGSAPLLDADEGRNGEVGREMAESNDYAVPRLNGVPYLDKPILYFAAEAGFMEVLGPTETAARLPAYLFTLLTAWLVYWFARRRWGSEEGLVAAIVYLAMPLTIAFARTVIFDSALSFFIVLAIIAFYEAVETQSKRWTLLGWAAIAFGVLTKGPVAIALPLLVMIPYAIWRKSFRLLWSLAGIAAFALIITPWLWAMQLAIPGFLQYALVTETAARLATKELQRTGPPWYFIPYLIAGALPWSIAAASNWKREWKSDRRVIFLLLWIVIPFIFFSISQSKRPQYIVPLMPAIALLTAHAWRELRVRAIAIGLAVTGAILLAAPLAPQFTRKMQPVVIEPARLAAFGLGALFLAGGLVALFTKRREIALISMSLPVLAIPLVAGPLMAALGERRSAHAVIEQLRPYLTPQTEIIGVEAFTGSMAFYARRPILVASDDASEYTSNYLIRHKEQFTDAPGSTLRSLAWFQRNLDECCTPRLYVVRNRDRARQQLFEARGMKKIAEGSHHIAYGPWTGK